jgi:DNA helicase-2/ATP-dependent DNA helicase PcrA
MDASDETGRVLSGLNDRQQDAVTHGMDPLLVVAGAGTGKTRTLVHRVAHLIGRGVDPSRIMLLTFTRRAAAEMLRRVDALLQQTTTSSVGGNSRRVWGGTFHAVAARLLRRHGQSIGLDASYTIMDRSDTADFLDVVRTELGMSKTDQRFPKKGTCVAIYSNCVNSQCSVEEVLTRDFPWFLDCEDDLKKLFRQYVESKDTAMVLDYDDLLLFWRALVSETEAGREIRDRFDCVLVDEYQDTNRLQAEILKSLRPDGQGLTVVGDDAQSIYSFRAATVENIMQFPSHYSGTTVVKLEQNYRSTEPILQLTNQVIAEARERFDKQLWSDRQGGSRPALVMCEDEDEQTEFLMENILGHRESGLQLREQAVLFRTSHHSVMLEAELTRRNIPFVKYGGLKFMETAHVKDVLAHLRWAENPRDIVAGTRVLLLLPGVGPKRAHRWMQELAATGGRFAEWQPSGIPSSTKSLWATLRTLMSQISGPDQVDLATQIALVRELYDPLLLERFDNAVARQRDLDQLELLVTRFDDRQSMLTDLALDPPASTGDFAGPPHLDEDYLILSTIHSAKGLEWKAVYVIHAADGNIPSDMSTKTEEEIEEERRLFYVALTRAQDWLYICCPRRYYHAPRGPRADRYGVAQLTRFVTNPVADCLDRQTAGTTPVIGSAASVDPQERRATVRRQLDSLWD